MSDPVELPLYWPDAMLAEIRAHANRLDVSLSWCVQRAWKLGRHEIAALPSQPENADADDGRESVPVWHLLRREITERRARYRGEPVVAGATNKSKQTLFFPPEMAAEIKAESARLDCSASTLVQCAWCAAVGSIEALTPSNRY